MVRRPTGFPSRSRSPGAGERGALRCAVLRCAASLPLHRLHVSLWSVLFCSCMPVQGRAGRAPTLPSGAQLTAPRAGPIPPPAPVGQVRCIARARLCGARRLCVAASAGQVVSVCVCVREREGGGRSRWSPSPSGLLPFRVGCACSLPRLLRRAAAAPAPAPPLPLAGLRLGGGRAGAGTQGNARTCDGRRGHRGPWAVCVVCLRSLGRRTRPSRPLPPPPSLALAAVCTCASRRAWRWSSSSAATTVGSSQHSMSTETCTEWYTRCCVCCALLYWMVCTPGSPGQ